MVTRYTSISRHMSVNALVTCGILLCFMASGTQAATQGDIGYSSKAAIELSLTIHPLVKVSGVQDIALNATHGESIAGSTPVCVGGTYAGTYSIEAQGSGSGNDFLLSSGDTTLPYAVEYSDAGGPVDLQPSSSSDNRPLAPSIECTEGTNALLTVAIDGAQSGGVPPGVYNGTLTLMVRPQ